MPSTSPGGDHRLDPALAVDGIDEFLACFLANARERAAARRVSVHLHCTDEREGDGEWTVRPATASGVVVTRDHAKADAALRGEANDLLMVLWRRLRSTPSRCSATPALPQAFVGRAVAE